jgi:WD40 repeat protein
MVDTEDIKYVDSLVQEYLLFRGFTTCIKVLDNEKKSDRLKGYHVSNIVSSLFSMVHQGNLQGVRELWNHLSDMFFSRLEEDLSMTVQKLDMSLKRYYVIHSVQSGHLDRALEFFKVCASELATDKHWKAWFVLPYLKSPESDPNFSIFFSKSWVESFTLSLHNFLATIFQSLPLPKILNFNIERKLRISLQNLNDSLMRENENLRTRNDKLRSEVDKLNRALTAANSKIQLLEQQIEMTLPTAAQLALLQHQQQQLASQQQKVNAAKKAESTASSDMTAASFRRTMGPIVSTKEMPVPGVGVSSSSSTGASTSAMAGSVAQTTMTAIQSGSEPHEDSQIGVAQPALLQTTKVESFSTNSPLNCCKFSPDGAFIACGTQTGVTRIWPVGPSNTQRSATIYGTVETCALAWDQDSKILLVGSGDGKVKVWNVALEKTVGDVTLGPYTRVRDIVCSPSGSMFACAASGLAKDPKASAIHLLNAKTLQLVAKIEFPTIINSFAFNHNESLIVAGGSDGYVTIIGMDNKEPMSSWKAHVGPVLNVTYSPDYTSIFTIGADSKLQRWDAHNSGKLLRQYVYTGAADGAKRVDFSFSSDLSHSSHSSQSSSLSSSSSSSSSPSCYFIVPSKAETAPIYDRDTTTPILAVGNHKAAVTCCDWHPQSLQVMTGCLGGVVCLTSFTPDKSSH